MPEDDEDGGMDSDDSDRKSKMSFSYWGADKVTLQKPLVKPRAPAGVHGARRGGPALPSGYSRESSANAKFGNRLVSAESAAAPRPASRRTQVTPTARRPAVSDDSHSAKVTVTRPAWDKSTRSAAAGATTVTTTTTTTPTTTSTPGPAKRSRNLSQNSAATRATTTSNKMLASPAPSEDSGVGLYRQMMAQDPSLNAA